MQDNKTKTILKALQQGRISVDDALLQLKLEPFQDLGYARWTITVVCAKGCRR